MPSYIYKHMQLHGKDKAVASDCICIYKYNEFLPIMSLTRSLVTVTTAFALALQDKLSETHRQVRGNLRMAGQAIKQYYDRRMREASYTATLAERELCLLSCTVPGRGLIQCWRLSPMSPTGFVKGIMVVNSSFMPIGCGATMGLETTHGVMAQRTKLKRNNSTTNVSRLRTPSLLRTWARIHKNCLRTTRPINQSWGAYAGEHVASLTLRRHSWRSHLASLHAGSLHIVTLSRRHRLAAAKSSVGVPFAFSKLGCPFRKHG